MGDLRVAVYLGDGVGLAVTQDCDDDGVVMMVMMMLFFLQI